MAPQTLSRPVDGGRGRSAVRQRRLVELAGGLTAMAATVGLVLLAIVLEIVLLITITLSEVITQTTTTLGQAV